MGSNLYKGTTNVGTSLDMFTRTMIPLMSFSNPICQLDRITFRLLKHISLQKVNSLLQAISEDLNTT